jgi:acetylornithine/N-succinyldiaminopimelate aminotransferase
MQHILKCHEIIKTDFVRGQNCSLYDAAGRRYVDLESGTWCTALGHNHPRINQVIEAQLRQVAHLGTRYPNQLTEEAALDVIDIVGMGDGKCVFLSSGSEAVEFGVQAARRITGRPLLLTFQSSYLSAFGSAGRKATDEWYLFDWRTCPDADPHDCLKDIPFEDIGAFVFEPGGSGIGFVTFPPKLLVQEIVRRVRDAGGLVVVNEVTTGMGRTGKWFGFQHYDLHPDIVAIGKGLGNGYPVSAVAMKPEVAESLEASGLHYAQSHQNDPLGCAVAREVIALFREGNWIERGKALGAYFLGGLKRLEEKHAVVREARGRGMLLGLELRPHESFSAEAAYRLLLEQGFLVGYYPAGNVLRFDPALTIKKDDIAQLLVCMDGLLESARIPAAASTPLGGIR